ncbi:MAG: helix-turn-helix domain-containing protein [Desulfobacterales bacterium]|nr:helix-turn-helix domain-containing protein [Desulfobacterales bacterium]
MEEKNFKKLLGELIYTARLEKGLTQKELGQQLGYIENSAGQIIHKIEEGKVGIPKKKISVLLNLLDIDHEKLGLPKSISLPIWISSGGKKGSGYSLKDFIDTAETVVTGIAELSETVATGVAELSGTVASGFVDISESLITGASKLSKKNDPKKSDYNSETDRKHDKNLFELLKEIISAQKETERITRDEKLRIVKALCQEDEIKLDKIKKILEL